MRTQLFLILPTLLITYSVYAQTSYPTNYFRSPVDSTLTLAGNFGEIRPNHFHAGFDVRTNNHEGKPVYAVADGYVSRIKISPLGYGKSIYITHPNGYTSVYGHLQRFETTIQAFTKRVQYSKKSFEIDTILSPDALPVKKGQQIALSGNTGGSEAPHLHFEIRDTKTEMPINPYYFGYIVIDTVKPKITALAIYPIGENATVNGKHQLKKMIPTSKNENYSLLKTDTINVNGDIGFGIECYDSENKSKNKNQVFSIELQSGGKRIYYCEFEKFTFENARYVNAHIDFAEKQKHNSKIQKCFLSKNNEAGIYKNVLNRGIISFTDDSIHWIRYIVKDFVGNTVEAMLKVKSSSKIKIKTAAANTSVFDCLRGNQFAGEDVLINIPAYALYDDLKFTYSNSPKMRGTYSLLHHIQNDETALQKAITLSIKPVLLPDALQNKACIISIDKKGKKNYEEGDYKNGWVTTQTKDLGNFAIAVDTTAPKLKPLFNYVPNTVINFTKAKTIGIKATDDLSGIQKYRATIDGNWVICEYEMKKDLLFYTFDDQITKGKHIFKIEVTDDKGNTSVLMFNFNR